MQQNIRNKICLYIKDKYIIALGSEISMSCLQFRPWSKIATSVSGKTGEKVHKDARKGYVFCDRVCTTRRGMSLGRGADKSAGGADREMEDVGGYVGREGRREKILPPTSLKPYLTPARGTGQFFNGSGRAWILVNFYFLSPSATGIRHCPDGFARSSDNDNRENAVERGPGERVYLPTNLPTNLTAQSCR